MKRIIMKSCDVCDDGSGWLMFGYGRWNKQTLEIPFAACADCNDDALKPKPKVKVEIVQEDI